MNNPQEKEKKCKNCELKDYLVVAITDDGKCRECGKEILPNFNLNETAPKENLSEGWVEELSRIMFAPFNSGEEKLNVAVV